MLVNSLSRCEFGFVFNYFPCTVNRKSCIEDIIIGNVLRWVQFQELQRACDCTGAKIRVSQRLKSLQRILVHNCGFSESDFFVVCEDIWIAICPFFVVVNIWTKTKMDIYKYEFIYFPMMDESYLIFIYLIQIINKIHPLKNDIHPNEIIHLWTYSSMQVVYISGAHRFPKEIGQFILSKLGQ